LTLHALFLLLCNQLSKQQEQNTEISVLVNISIPLCTATEKYF